jgi:hypothetical protein
LLGFKVDDSGREQYNKGIDQTKQKQQSLTASFLKANLIMSTVNRGIGVAFSFVRHEVIGATAETERFRVVIGNMIGDQEKANKVIHELDYSPVSDFYGTAATIGGLRSFVTMGMDIEKAKDQMTLLGDVAQGNGEAFASLSSTMAQVYSRGKADAMRLKQFMSQGFDVAGVLGLTEAQQKAGVTYAQVEEALKRVTAAGGPYNNMLQKQMNTLGGLIKQFKSLKAATAEAIGLGINDDLKGLLKYILEIGRVGQESFVNKFVGALKEVIHWIWQIIIMWKVLGYRLSDMGDALKPVKQFFTDLKDVAGDALTGIMKLSIEVGRFIVAAFRPIQAFASPIIKELGAIAKDVFTAIADFIRPLIPMASDSAGFFGFLGKAIAGLLRPALAVALAIRGVNTAIAIVKGTMLAVKTVIAAVKAAQIGCIAVMRLSMEGNKAAAAMMKLYAIRIKAVEIAEKAAAIAGKVWAGIQWMINTAMSANPIGLIIVGIVALIGIIILLVKNWDKVKAAFGKTGEVIKSGVGKLGGFFSGIGNKLAEVFGPAVNKVKEKTKELLVDFKEKYPALYETLADIFGKIKAVVTAVFGWIKKYFSAVWQSLKASLGALFEVYKSIFFAIWNVVKTAGLGIWSVIKAVFDAVKNTVMSVLNVFKTIFTGVLNIIKTVFSAILNTVLSIFDGLISIWKDDGNFFVKLWESIKLIFTQVWQGIFTIVKAVLTAIINIWKSVFNVFSTILEGIQNVFFAAWDAIKNNVLAVVEGIENIWISFAAFWGTLFNGIKTIASVVWDGIADVFSGAIDNIKAVWNGITGFFSGLWETIKEGPAEAIEYIKNDFLGLFNSIQEKLFGFINKIKEGWETVKGFFGGIGEGVVNFITGGDSGGGQMQPAYAGSTSQAAMARSVGQTSNYAYTTMGGSSTVNAQTSINVNVPSGTPQEQREAIARQVNAQFNARLADSINSSRANIPSPEVRRH